MNSVELVDSERGIYKICDKFWTVGKKYRLQEHIGSGSYGDVCRAIDFDGQMVVALKRVPDVLCCQLLAKRVLREVCIMRRLSHPFIISLTDVFINPSIEVNGGVDLYIATEFADSGDMYHIRSSLSAEDVKMLFFQLLVGVNYMHKCRVWHRDIKSENVLLSSKMCVKICDFGLSRSAEESSATLETQKGPFGQQQVVMGKKSLKRQYTKTVVTPSYRAPEVIMSRGQYTSAIDMWSLGCIFWELLMRSMNPTQTGPLRRPLFGVREEPITPGNGESYMADHDSPLHEQLDVIFNVIGTPCWDDIETIPSENWKSYLKRLPGRAGNLARQLAGHVEDEALDLLSRMLAFNPSRRCSAEEALAHAYFINICRPNDIMHKPFEGADSSESCWKIRDPAIALAFLERELEISSFEPDGGRAKLQFLLQSEIDQQKQQNMLRYSSLANFPARVLARPNNFGGIVLDQPPDAGYIFFGSIPGSHVHSQTINEVPCPPGMTNGGQFISSQEGIQNGDCIMESCQINKQDNGRERSLSRKTIVRQGSLRIEIEKSPKGTSLSSTRGSRRNSSSVSSCKNAGNMRQATISRRGDSGQLLELLPRRSPRLKDLAIDAPQKKRSCLKV